MHPFKALYQALDKGWSKEEKKEDEWILIALRELRSKR